LKRARYNLIESDLLDPLAKLLRRHWSGDTGIDKGSQAFSQAFAETFTKAPL